MFYPYPFNQSSSNKVLHGDGTWKEIEAQDVCISTTYSELKSLRESGNLQPGCKYRITDYATTTSQQDTQSAGHQFDIVVEALAPNVLSENAKAIQHGDGATGLYLWEKYDSTYQNYASEIEGGVELSKFYIVTDRLYTPGSLSLTNYATVLGTLRVPNADEIAYTTEEFEDVLVECVLEDIDCPNAVDMGGGKQLTVYKNDLEDYESGSEDYQTPDYGDWYVYVGQFDDVNHLFGDVADDSYFNDSNLNAWQIKYCLDNDKDRFAWADETNGKGVIYYMKDEWNNECPYDFKNIQFKRWAITDVTSTKLSTEALNSLKAIFVYNNSTLPIRYAYQSSNITSGSVTFVVGDGSNSDFYYTFTWIDENNQVQDASIVGQTLPNDEDLYTGVYGNCIKPSGEYNTIGGDGESFRFVLPSNVFVSSYAYKSGYFYGIYGNNLEVDCYNNTFGNGCNDNSFGNGCNDNSFGNVCYNNSFGNSCFNNSFGNNCNDNSFGNNCNDNSFGNSCFNNSFGNECYDNSFGNECYDNSFGNSCYYNSFGNSCQSNSFGNGCNDNSFGDRCGSNSFGNVCSDIRFDKQYTCKCIVEDSNRNITLTSTQTTSSSTSLCNIQISLGAHDTTGALTITHPTVNDTYQTVYGNINGVIAPIQADWNETDSNLNTYIKNKPDISKCVSITYADLVDIRDDSELVPGTWYRITDYTTTTTQTNTQSAGHQFDVVVLALSENKLSENANVIMYDNIYDVTFDDNVTKKCYVYNTDSTNYNVVDIDTLLGIDGVGVPDEMTVDETNKTATTSEYSSTALQTADLRYNYFQDCKLESWQIKYCLDNDTDRFAWAKTSIPASIDVDMNGRNLLGVRTPNADIDEYGLFAWYDANLGEYVYTKTETPDVMPNPSTLYNSNNVDYGQGYVIGGFTSASAAGIGVIYYMKDEWGNECPYDFKNIQFKRKLTNGSLDTTSGADTWVYTFNFWDGSECKDYTLYNGQSLTDSYHMTAIRFMVYDNLMLPCYKQNGPSTSNCTFVLNDNVFLNIGNQYSACYNNVFRNNCYSNSFGSGCYGNSFGSGCYNNSFGSCNNNSFGNNCFNNSFGNNCFNNSFGSYCYSNSFGNSCHDNSFGIDCHDNSFGNTCYNNSFENTCHDNSFGGNCNANSFGNSCNYITFDKQYTQYCIVENVNQYITLTTSQTTSSSNPLRNIQISLGVNNTNTTKTITHPTVNDTFKTTYKPINSVEVSV